MRCKKDDILEAQHTVKIMLQCVGKMCDCVTAGRLLQDLRHHD